MFLFCVEDTFVVQGKGLILAPGVGTKKVNTGMKIKLIRPDHSIIETIIKGIIFEGNHNLFVDLQKEDVPRGTAIWLIA